MSLRSILAVSVLVLGCGSTQGKSDEPTTAKEKMALEAKKSGESYETGRAGASWGAWRYSGDRNECFFVVGRKCFKTENAACQAARCKAPKKCETVGGGPATVSCTK